MRQSLALLEITPPDAPDASYSSEMTVMSQWSPCLTRPLSRVGENILANIDRSHLTHYSLEGVHHISGRNYWNLISDNTATLNPGTRLAVVREDKLYVYYCSPCQEGGS